MGKDLGRVLAIYPIAPAYQQRAVFIAVLSFLFFVAMMLAFYLRQTLGYFLLATAFLFVYLITMFSWFIQRKSVAKVYDRGFEFKDRVFSWDEFETITYDRRIVITPKSGKPLELPTTISEPAALARHIKFHIDGSLK